MSHDAKLELTNPIIRWIDKRLPIFSYIYAEYGVFPMPKNLNYWWSFGAMAMIALVVMIVTGIMLAMQYTPHVSMAFQSVERIMRDVNNGWLLRYIHMNGASMFFIAVYAHIFRGLFYGSYKTPRELVWIFGVVILVVMMGTAFMGYVLPWGQMSFWGATVITNLFSALPIVGEPIVTWLWGGFSVDNPTLNRFFALHYLLPFVIFAIVILHIITMHIAKSNNPDGVEVQSAKDVVPFHPYFTAKDIYAVVIYLILFAWFVFYSPNYMGHPDNYIEANPMSTPAHIVPEWYFLPYYAILRSFTDDFWVYSLFLKWFMSAKLAGVLAMFGSLVLLALLPWLDTSPVKSCRYRPVYRVFILIFVADVLLLGYCGGKPAEGWYVSASQWATFYYFLHFLIITPLIGWVEKPSALPVSISSTLAKRSSSAMALLLVASLVGTGVAQAAGDAKPAEAANHGHMALPKVNWSFLGYFGQFDRQQLQRGLQVYTEVCASCHSLNLIHYRDLADLGYSPEQVKELAARHEVSQGPNDAGDMEMKPAKPEHSFVKPFANEQAARASNGGALPPDLSLIVKSRATPDGSSLGFVTNFLDAIKGREYAGGADYVAALLQGYGEPPAGFELMPGLNYNSVFSTKQIAMPQPLMADSVTYADGTKASLQQQSEDVAAFLTWASEPAFEARRSTGLRVMLFLIAFGVVMAFVKRRVWSKIEH